MNDFQNNAVFWLEIEKIEPNPFQPRREFDPDRLRDLADSIRQYGVLQPLVVTRNEVFREDGGISVKYELIAGERRLRASKLAGLSRVPALIRSGVDTEQAKLELAIIENLQREDLNPLERAKAFQQLIQKFNFKHEDVARKVGKSRVYVSNSLRLLSLPENVQESLLLGKISEGHTRPIMMLSGKPEEQETLLREIMYKKLNVRQAERIARGIAREKARPQRVVDPEVLKIEEEMTEKLGSRVTIEKKEHGGKITINFFSPSDLDKILVSMGYQKKDDNNVSEIEETISVGNGEGDSLVERNFYI
jgi:ParB family chromosome partitioning protein